MRTANLLLKFFLELVAFGGLAVYGASIHWALGLVFPLVAIGIWGRWCAPKAPNRLPTRQRVPLEGLVLVAAAVAWALATEPWVGVAFAALVAVNAAGLATFDDWDA